jgi:peptidoglycan-associated lipoprotein
MPLRFGLGLLAITFLVSCGNPANPPPPKWTTENPNAATGAPAKTAAPKPAAKPSPSSDSSLEALRKGEAPTSGPLKDIAFNFDSAALSNDARATLKANADWLSEPGGADTDRGHCDERGTAEYNMALGAKRARRL